MITKFIPIFTNFLFKKKETLPEQHISEEGLELIKNFEGYMAKTYLDVAGYPTIGYGHLITTSEKLAGTFKNKVLSEEEATKLLKQDVVKTEQSINRLVKVPLSQNQFDALVDFVFNLGEGALTKSTLLKKLNNKEYDVVPSEMLKWNKAKNPKTGTLVENKGLTSRRIKEGILWAK